MTSLQIRAMNLAISVMKCLLLLQYNITGTTKMKILAIEKEIDGKSREDMAPLLKQEAIKVLELYQTGLIREIYFTQEDHSAVIVLECLDENEAREVLNSLPLVQEGMIQFETATLLPYTGFSRLMLPDE